jgi:hypothetical protein
MTQNLVNVVVIRFTLGHGKYNINNLKFLRLWELILQGFSLRVFGGLV